MEIELKDYRYRMVLHEHQENPHVHRSVRAESMGGKRLNPRKVDLHRWRETFAERLRGYGVEAEATLQATRGQGRRFENLWQVKARDEGRLRNAAVPKKLGDTYMRSRIGALEAWAHITSALRTSEQPGDRELAQRISSFVLESDFGKEHSRKPGREIPMRPSVRDVEPTILKARTGPEIKR